MLSEPQGRKGIAWRKMQELIEKSSGNGEKPADLADL